MAEVAFNSLGRVLPPVRRMLRQLEKWVSGKTGLTVTLPWDAMPLIMCDIKDC